MNITILGSGKMGEALARGMLRAGFLQPEALTLTDIIPAQAQTLAAALGASALSDNALAVANATLVIIAVKPKNVAALCHDIAAALPAACTVVSIAAGITLNQLAGALQRNDLSLVRVMPNTPCLVGAGAIGVSFAPAVPDEVRGIITSLLTTIGLVETFPEALLDAVTGLSGSGPAYIAVLIEALADGGVLMGLPRAQAQRLATQTVLGTASVLLETQQHPAQLKDAVSSPGGTTIAGLAALEDGGFRSAAIAAVKAATLRSKALSEE